MCELLFAIPPSITGKPAKQKVTKEQSATIRDGLLACQLSWQQCASVRAADQLERRLLDEFRPHLNRV